MARVRHYTRKSSKDKIVADGRVIARDQNKVFVEYADADPHGPRDAEERYLLKRGKGNAYVEFDVGPADVQERVNPLTGKREYFLLGDVDLTLRKPRGVDNV